MLDKPGLGFVLGKFMPPHAGHVYLCEFARNYCRKLIILVCSMPNEPIPGHLRAQWMRELFPDCIVLHEERELPQEPGPLGDNDLEFWSTWQGVVQDAVRTAGWWGGPDVVFASETYGRKLAQVSDARFVPVDIDRSVQAISGTEIRNNPFKNWKYIPNVVRPYYTKRVTLFGPESSGKTTLATSIAGYFDTVVAPEYGRVYTETFGPEVVEEDLLNIVRGHLAGVQGSLRAGNRILVEDTDPLMTAVWAEMLLNRRVPELDAYTDYPELYLLTKPDIPWEDDGTRYFSKEEDRWRFFDICEKKLRERNVNYVIIGGEHRLLDATDAIEQHLF